MVDRARGGLAAGQTFVKVARELDIRETSLRLWMRQLPEKQLQPVEVVAGPAPTGLIVRTPDGFQIDGLDVEGAAVLVECLR